MEKTRVYLLTEYPFYASLLNQCIIYWSKKVPTAGVRINSKGNVELAVNKKFFYSLSEYERVGLLMHEMLHLSMNHLVRSKDMEKKRANVAMDIAINQYIASEFMPPGALLPHQFGLVPNKPFEYYYKELSKREAPEEELLDVHDWDNANPQKGDAGSNKKSGGKGKDDKDDNNSDDEKEEKKENKKPDNKAKGEEKQDDEQEASGSGQDKDSDSEDNNDNNNDSSEGEDQEGALSDEIKQQLLKNMVSKAITEAEGIDPGSVPMPVKIEMEQLKLNQPKVNWRQRLRNFIGKRYSIEKESTRNKPNRRLGFKAPGRRSLDTAKIIIAIDESGSVDNNKRNILIGELSGTLKAIGDKTEIVFFDTEIQHSMMLSKLNGIPPRYAGGGTNFQAVVDYANPKKPDLLIMFTDGECSMPTGAKYPILWVLTGQSSDKHLTGIKVNLNE